ncbi:MAG: hypothetical protein GTN84_08285 [Hydrogenophaga sp.]|uniref:hypothetical protein n=1 Tax=Hydrogenophaga sp. TaxID=1904254 RepID=UPI0016AB3431|nr:hypothetical protein [Hydrogenophaga sp.]NIM41088.1 hypothetical protein [Hydrogenophaga sp.]NIN26404.1 hypothetical protein [Hydrogenophaga sp.]NIN31279.1 hypothetical protein [Hydrogenophaga sp.]NIN55334.1 hypothetical protein [Hydrogenophaga sp.]NIO51669.1 hypothetical protein [Hydrogenophaga sp.]
MGLLFHSFASNSWRKPLQLIDCWLPEPRTRASAPTRASAASATPAVRRFARAGWLGRSAANGPLAHDGRVALAGRIDDVCRELDRLAAQDEAAPARLRRQMA